MYTHLVIGGGGVKGSAIVGCLHTLFKKNKLSYQTLEGLCGSSVGGLLCFLLNIGYTPNELKDIMLNIDFNQYRSINFSDIFDKWGLDNGESFMKLVGAIVKQKNSSINITFEELFQQTQKLLVITGSDLISNKAIYYNHIDNPNMKILDAIRITISYPIIFHPCILNDDKKLLIDGAIFDPYPMSYFNEVDNDKKIGIFIHNQHSYIEITDCEEYLMAMIECLQERYEKFYIEKYIENTIIIDVRQCHSMDFSIDHNTKLKMYICGKQSANLFISNKG